MLCSAGRRPRQHGPQPPQLLPVRAGLLLQLRAGDGRRGRTVIPPGSKNQTENLCNGRKDAPRFPVLRKWGRKTEIEEYWRVHLSSLSSQLNTRNRDSNPRKSDWKHVPREAELSSCDSNLMIMMMLMWLLPLSPSLLITLELGRHCIIVHWS